MKICVLDCRLELGTSCPFGGSPPIAGEKPWCKYGDEDDIEIALRCDAVDVSLARAGDRRELEHRGWHSDEVGVLLRYWKDS